MKVVKNTENRWDVLNQANEVVFNAETRAKAIEWKKVNEVEVEGKPEPTSGETKVESTPAKPSNGTSKSSTLPGPTKAEAKAVEEKAKAREAEAKAATPKPTPVVKTPKPATTVEPAPVPTGDVTVEHLFGLVQEAAAVIKSATSADLIHGMTSTQADILEMLTRYNGGVPQKVIASTIDCTGGNVTMVVDNLEKKGLVRRDRFPEDRRIVLVSLTETGTAAVKEVTKVRKAAMKKLFGSLKDFSVDEANEVATFLRALKSAKA